MSVWARDTTGRLVTIEPNETKMTDHVSPPVLMDRCYLPWSSYPSCIRLLEASENNYELKSIHNDASEVLRAGIWRRVHVHQWIRGGLHNDEDPAAERRCCQIEIHSLFAQGRRNELEPGDKFHHYVGRLRGSFSEVLLDAQDDKDSEWDKSISSAQEGTLLEKSRGSKTFKRSATPLKMVSVRSSMRASITNQRPYSNPRVTETSWGWCMKIPWRNG